MFVPRCCLPQTNLRKYSRDADAVLLAERAAYYQPVGVSRFGHERGAYLPYNLQVTSITARAGYIWIFYRWPDKKEHGLLEYPYDLTKFVMAARYTEDLEEEFVYYETEPGIVERLRDLGQWPAPPTTSDPANPNRMNDKRHYGVDDNGNLTYMTGGQAISDGGTKDSVGIRSYDLDGELRWEIDEIPSPSGLLGSYPEAIAVDSAGSVWVVHWLVPPPPPMGIQQPATLNCAKFNDQGVYQFTVPLTTAAEEQAIIENDAIVTPVTVGGYQVAMQGNTPIVYATRCKIRSTGSPIYQHTDFKHRFWKVPSGGGGAVLQWEKPFTVVHKRLRNMTFPTSNLRGSIGGQDSWVIEYDVRGIDQERRVLRFSPTSTEKDPYSATVPTWFGEVNQGAAGLGLYPSGQFSPYTADNKHNDCCDSDGTGRLIVLDGQSVEYLTFPNGTPTGAVEHPRLAQINSAGGTDWTSDPITRYEEPGSGHPNATAAELHVAVSGNAIFVTSDGQYW